MTAAIGARLAQALLASQRIDADQLDIALAEQQRHGLSLADALVQLGFVAERDMCGALAELLGLCSVDVRMAEPEPEALAMLPAQHARQLCVLPLRYQPQARTLCVAMARPTDLRAQDQLIAISQGQVAHIDPMLASETDLLQALDRCYGPPLSLDSVLREWRERADQAADDAPAVKLADALIHDAVRQGASDIHLEPEARFVRLRYRVDGVLRPVRSLQQAQSIISTSPRLGDAPKPTAAPDVKSDEKSKEHKASRSLTTGIDVMLPDQPEFASEADQEDSFAKMLRELEPASKHRM